MGKKIFLTFDLEEWPSRGHYNFEPKFDKNIDFSREGCLRLLDLLDKHDIKCTFFTTGFFARSCPQLIKRLVENGHEIASHAFYNLDLTAYDYAKIENQINKTSKLLSDLQGGPVIGFRAPYFRFDSRIGTILEDNGFKYDSSVHPAIVPGHYYNFTLPLTPYYRKFKKGDGTLKRKGLLEIPISVIPGLRIPISWWWMRNLGNWLSEGGAKINLKSGRDVVLYFHPWEFTTLPNIKGIPHHVTRGCGISFLSRLDNFIKKFADSYRFNTLSILVKSTNEVER